MITPRIGSRRIARFRSRFLSPFSLVPTLMLALVLALVLAPGAGPLLAAPDPIAPPAGLRESTPRVQAFTHARLVLAPGRRVERGTLVVRDGVIVAAGADVTPPADAVLVDCTERWEAMIPVLERRMPLLVSANEVHQIEAAVAFAAAESLRLVLHGGYDAPFIAPLLKAHDVPVIVSAVHRLPARRASAYDDPFTLPERLRQAGVRFAIGAGGGGWNDRNLPYHAATAAAYGLPPEEALRAITLSPAEILGVADRVGSLEPGKDATLFLATGDPLEEATRIERAFIQGRVVDLSDKQKVLYEKYREKYRRLGGSTGSGTSSR